MSPISSSRLNGRTGNSGKPNDILRKASAYFALAELDRRSLEWVDWFNHRRLLEPIGNIPPAEAEERYYAMLEQTDMAA